jgi:hypothetical protein
MCSRNWLWSHSRNATPSPAADLPLKPTACTTPTCDDAAAPDVVEPIDFSSAGTDALQALKRVVHVDRLKRIPALRGVTDDDKPAFYLRRLRDGLGTVEAIHGVSVSRKNRSHTVDVKWLHVSTDSARDAGLSTIAASKLKRNDVLKNYCVANGIDFKALTNGGEYSSVRFLPASSARAPEFVPSSALSASASAVDTVSTVDTPTESAMPPPDDHPSSDDDDSRYLRYVEVNGKVVAKARLVPASEWNQQQHELAIASPAPAPAPSSPSPRSRSRMAVRYAPDVVDPAPRRTRTGRISRAPLRG